MAAGARRRGIPFVLSGPSGTGKTTVCRALVDGDPQLIHSVSYTTRAPRAGERDGVHYHFVSREAFEKLVAQQTFVEHAEYGGNLYGTSAARLDAALAQGVDVLLEIEVQGAAQIRARRPDARLLFLLPPSREELEHRLRARGTDRDAAVERRLALARREMEAVDLFDYAVVNDDLERAIAELREILAAERAGRTDAVRARHGRAAVVGRLRGRLGLA
jgi:guanylate kinase